MAGTGAVPLNPVQPPPVGATTPPPVGATTPPPVGATTPPPAGMMPPVEMMPPAAGDGMAMDECNLDTGYPGDEYCILPPPPDKGFQVHLGPRDYNNPEPQFVMEPDTENTVTMPATSGNTMAVHYYFRQYRMRPGSHHWIVTSNGRRIGGTQNLSKDNPERGMIAPENMGVGMPLAARASLENSLHYYNFTPKAIIKEVWMNVWYRDPKDVTEPALEVFSMLGMGIPPGTKVVKAGSCRVNGTGRMLSVYGHVHANNRRFSAWRTRGGQKTLLHEAYDWEHPTVSEFSSLATNPPLDPMNPAAKRDGGFSGVVDLKPGDLIEFECDIVNDTNTTFLGRNEAENDEMCIMIGDTVGASVPAFCTQSELPGGTSNRPTGGGASN
jgi:hypothetical protein